MRRHLPNHSVFTAFELGWSELSNGELLAAAETRFDALVTTDQHLRQQQNLVNRKIFVGRTILAFVIEMVRGNSYRGRNRSALNRS
jgi:hypothetical protein